MPPPETPIGTNVGPDAVRLSVLESTAIRNWLEEASAHVKADPTQDIWAIRDVLSGNWTNTKALAPEAILQRWSALKKTPLPRNHYYGLYTHIPFCRSRCRYCVNFLRVIPSPGAIRAYVDNMHEEARFFAPLFSDCSFSRWAVGGGTPSLLEPDMLHRWLEPISRMFNFDADCMRTAEFNPSSTDRRKLEALKSIGFNRISFGVQSLDAGILHAVNRDYQTLQTVRRALRSAAKAGFDWVNADLIFGFMHEPPDSFMKSFRLIAEMRPTSITVYALNLTDGYLRGIGVTRAQYQSYFDAVLPRVREDLSQTAASLGYKPSMFGSPMNWCFELDGTAAARSRAWREYHRQDWGSSFLGLGSGSTSHIFGQAVYAKNMAPFAPRKALYQKADMTRKAEMSRHIVVQLNLESRVRYGEFRDCFGEDVRNCFALELAALRREGQIREDAAGFDFLPTRHEERILFGLYFFMSDLAKIARFRRMAPKRSERALSRCLKAFRKPYKKTGSRRGPRP